MSTPTYRIETYSHPGDFPDDVLNLFNLAETTDIEFGTTWLRNLIETVFTDRKNIRIYVLRRNATPIIGLPLLLVKKSFGEELHSLSNFYTSLYSPATAPDVNAIDFEALLNSVANLHPSLVAFRLDPLDSESDIVRQLKIALTQNRFQCIEYFRFFNWYENIRGDWSQYLSERAGQVRSTLKRKLAKLQKEEGSVEIVQAGPGLESAISDYVSVYADSWKRPEPFVDFVPGLLRAAAGRGWLRMGMVRLRGTVIAAQIWLIHDGRASIFKLAYRESHKSYSPGSLLTAHLMQAAMENDQVRVVDYLTGDDGYKREWMSNQRSRTGLLAANRRHPMGLALIGHHWIAERTRPLRLRIKQLRTVAKLARGDMESRSAPTK